MANRTYKRKENEVKRATLDDYYLYSKELNLGMTDDITKYVIDHKITDKDLNELFKGLLRDLFDQRMTIESLAELL